MSEKITPNDFYGFYDLVERVGEGGSAEVFRCVRKESEQEYAVKLLRSTTSCLRSIANELRICRKLDHANVVKLVDYYAKDTIHYLVFNMEWGGELLRDIIERTTYTEYDACHCIEQILNGVDYLHKNNIVHRDLQSKNVLLTDKHKDAVVKIADFGSAGILSKNENFRYRGAETGFYMAPEMLSRQPCGLLVDVWACGILLYIMLIGRPPFYGSAQLMILQMTSRKYWLPEDGGNQSLCKDGKDLIRLLLNPESNSRISVQKALRHTFIKKRKDVASRFHRQKTIEELRRHNTEIKARWKSAVKSISRFMKLRKRDGHVSKDDFAEHAGEQTCTKMLSDDSAPAATPRDKLPNIRNPNATSESDNDMWQSVETESSTDEDDVSNLESHESRDTATTSSTSTDSVMAQIAGMTLTLSTPTSGITDPRRRRAPKLASLGRSMAFDEGDGRKSSSEISEEENTSAGIESLASSEKLDTDKSQSGDDFDKSDKSEPDVPDMDSSVTTQVF